MGEGGAAVLRCNAAVQGSCAVMATAVSLRERGRPCMGLGRKGAGQKTLCHRSPSGTVVPILHKDVMVSWLSPYIHKQSSRRTASVFPPSRNGSRN